MRYIGILILLVLCLTLLLLTGCVVNTVIPETTMGNLGNQENTEEPVIEEPVIEEPVIEEPIIEDTEVAETESPQKWSGLGMGLFSTEESYIDTLLANGFEELRIDIPDYQDTRWLLQSKAAVKRAVTKGVKVIWGVSSNGKNDPAYTITAANWPAYRQAILDAAQWAQDNGVYEFQLGNEEETHNDDTTITDAQLIINLKSVATDVQAIFTKGNVSYTSGSAYFMGKWNTAGRGDIDILAANIYTNLGDWQIYISNLVSWFGVDHTYITEFSLSCTSLDDYSTDEEVQATAISEMIDYIKASGIKRAFYFCYQSDNFGALKDDGTYRLLWNQALLNTGPVKFVTVPTKTTTASLPDAIAHLYQ